MALVPPVLLLTYMHLYNGIAGPPWRAGWLTVFVMVVAVLVGAAGILVSGWSLRVKVWTTVGYFALAALVAPALALAAQCTTGDCI
jgi:hypothetical protein